MLLSIDGFFHIHLNWVLRRSLWQKLFTRYKPVDFDEFLHELTFWRQSISYGCYSIEDGYCYCKLVVLDGFGEYFFKIPEECWRRLFLLHGVVGLLPARGHESKIPVSPPINWQREGF